MGNDSSNGYGDEMGLPSRLEGPGSATPMRDILLKVHEPDPKQEGRWCLGCDELWPCEVEALRSRVDELKAALDSLVNVISGDIGPKARGKAFEVLNGYPQPTESEER